MMADTTTPLDLVQSPATDQPDAAASGVPDALATAVPTPSPSATADVVKGAEGIKQAVSSKSQTMGDLMNSLDSMAISAGDMRISVLDGLFLIVVVLGVYLLGWLATKLAHSALKRMTRLDPSQRLLSEKLLTLVVWAIAILIGIDILGIDLTAFAVFSGAFGLAIGFGLQKTFGNLIAGIILLMDKSIKPGDVIAIADQAGNETFGQIRKIGIRAVSVTTRDQREYLIPNENLMINQVENWSYSSRNVRMQVEVGVSYECDIAKAEELMLEAARSCKRVLDAPPPSVWLKEYGDSSVNFTIHCWITDPEQGVGNVRSEVLKKLWWLLKENDIDIPFPQRDLNLKGNEEFRELIAALRGGQDPKT